MSHALSTIGDLKKYIDALDNDVPLIFSDGRGTVFLDIGISAAHEACGDNVMDESCNPFLSGELKKAVCISLEGEGYCWEELDEAITEDQAVAFARSFE